MLGTAKKTEEKYRVNIHQHFKSFAADNEQLKPLLQVNPTESYKPSK